MITSAPKYENQGCDANYKNAQDGSYAEPRTDLVLNQILPEIVSHQAYANRKEEIVWRLKDLLLHGESVLYFCRTL